MQTKWIDSRGKPKKETLKKLTTPWENQSLKPNLGSKNKLRWSLFKAMVECQS